MFEIPNLIFEITLLKEDISLQILFSYCKFCSTIWAFSIISYLWLLFHFTFT